MYTTIDLEWMLVSDELHHRKVHLYGKYLMAVPLRSICMWYFFGQIHHRKFHGMVDNEWHRDEANRQI